MNQLTPEEYQQLLTLGTENGGLEEQMAMQMAQAKQMRAGGAPGMRDMGRVKMAPHWMELLGGLAKQKTGGDLERAALATGKTRQGNMNAQNQMIMRGILGGQGIAPTVYEAPPARNRFSFNGD